jgi:hypothetical protein
LFRLSSFIGGIFYLLASVTGSIAFEAGKYRMICDMNVKEKSKDSPSQPFTIKYYREPVIFLIELDQNKVVQGKFYLCQELTDPIRMGCSFKENQQVTDGLTVESSHSIEFKYGAGVLKHREATTFKQNGIAVEFVSKEMNGLCQLKRADQLFLMPPS